MLWKSEISQQVAFYDAGLGTSETDKFSIKKIGVLFGSAFGTGITQNIADCYDGFGLSYQLFFADDYSSMILSMLRLPCSGIVSSIPPLPTVQSNLQEFAVRPLHPEK